MKAKTHTPSIIYQPTKKIIQHSNIYAYQQWIAKRIGKKIENYSTLWEWSVNHIDDFWESIHDYFHLQLTYKKVLSGTMPQVTWFNGSTLNYAEQVFKQKINHTPAMITLTEDGNSETYSWQMLENQVSQMQSYFKKKGIKKGDRIVAYINNGAEAVISFLATISLGAIWSSVSTELGEQSVMDRFAQIQPTLLIASEGYMYKGKYHSKIDVIHHLQQSIASLQSTILIQNTKESQINLKNTISWLCILNTIPPSTIYFEPLPFNYPIWILYSSGTTGLPKAITHSHGGMLFEHLKYMYFHYDIKKGDRFFCYTTTGWMMWNFSVASLLAGSTFIAFNGATQHPDWYALWHIIEKFKINIFVTSSAFLLTCAKEKLIFKNKIDLSSLREIVATGSPLTKDPYIWVKKEIKKNMWIHAISGGTDVCSAFLAGNPTLPVYEAEMQCAALGTSVDVYNEKGKSIVDKPGELVITKPLIAMPIYFWNDPLYKKYKESYFEVYKNIWRHGDWAIFYKLRKTYAIFGRSDATLNKNGVRIGTSEIYQCLQLMDIIDDSLIINIEYKDGSSWMPLFVKLKNNQVLDKEIIKAIQQQLRIHCSPRHVPDVIYTVTDIPYTLSGKKVEIAIKKLFSGIDWKKSINKNTLRNPLSLNDFVNYYKQEKGKKT